MRLEMPAAVTVPLARLAARDHDDMAELGPAAVEMVVDHDPSAHAGSEREHDQIRRTSPRAEAPFGKCRSVAIVLDPGWDGVQLTGAIGKVHAVEREVDRAERDARAPVDVQRD